MLFLSRILLLVVANVPDLGGKEIYSFLLPVGVFVEDYLIILL